MIRSMLAVAVLVFGATALVAEDDPIPARKALMKRNNQAAQQGTKFMKGEEAFDLAKAQAMFATFQDVAAKIKPLFPENSKTGGDTLALPPIWENKADFEARLAKLGADAKDAAAKVKDEASFKTAFPAVTKNCIDCHQTYRKKPS